MDADWLEPPDPADYWKDGSKPKEWKDNDTLAREAIALSQERLIEAFRLSPRHFVIRMRSIFSSLRNEALMAAIDYELSLTDEERAERRKWR